jgi:uncharacterized protein YbcC (UPF0753/DUF2309 family)
MMSAHSALHSQTSFDLEASLHRLAHWLPTQNPLKDFIHHNTLHALEDQPFHTALAMASKLYGSKLSLPLSDYQARYQEGRIYKTYLDLAIRRYGIPESELNGFHTRLHEPDDQAHYPPRSLAVDGIRHAWHTTMGVHLDAWVHPVLFRLISNYLDQGISYWAIPDQQESFWCCIQRLVHDSFVPLYPLGDSEVSAWLQNSPDDAIAACLHRLVGHPAHYEQYLLEMLLAHPGWSGMVHVIEHQPSSLLFRRQASLKETLAVELLLQWAFLNTRNSKFKPLIETIETADYPGLELLQSVEEIDPILKIWHEAMEMSLYADLILAIQEKPRTSESVMTPSAQAVFCIDDRECSIRRHLESVSPTIETFGAAGFFGIEFFYKGIEDVFPVAQCPIVVKPQHLVVEKRTHALQSKVLAGKRAFTPTKVLRNWLWTQTIGLAYGLRLLIDVFRPGTKIPQFMSVDAKSTETELHLYRAQDECNEEGHLLGFTFSEMADRIEGFLRNIGLTTQFAPVVLMVAHGSTTTNNPHFAAYDCGACSGKPGAPNARAFAQMANEPMVRSLLAERGILIPAETVFVAALHDTTADTVEYFDLKLDQRTLPAAFFQFKRSMQEALRRNAHERSRWFELGPSLGDFDLAHQHVKDRSLSIFEPRPEYNHSNNLYCVVGRRSLTRGLFLDRRAFLHSYEPRHDPKGLILQRILSQVIPVCGGINLEYYFSTVDNSIYGAGTKLPHNVMGLVGVANGVEGDLRTGLPSQMIEVHEPARLLIVVEQDSEIIDLALKGIGSLTGLIERAWVHLVSCDPEHRSAQQYLNGHWVPFELPKGFRVPRAPDSKSVYEGKNRTIPVHILEEQGV